MNKIYRLIWNPVLRAWIAVGEFAKAKGKKNGINSVTIITGAALLTFSPLNTAHAWMIDIATGQVVNASIQADDTGDNTNTAIGNNAKAVGSTDGYATAVGADTQTGDKSVAVGGKSSAGFAEAVSVGYQSTAYGNYAIAIGSNSYAVSEGTIAIGNHAGTSSINNLMTNLDNIAIGHNAGNEVTGSSNIALGKSAGSKITATNTLALGTNATANENNAVALGANSVTATAVNTSAITLLGVTYQFAGTDAQSTVSVGNSGTRGVRTLTNVAAGRISSTSTDAINGSQLFAVGDAVTQLNETAVQYNYTLDPNTGDRTPDYSSITLNGGTGGTTITNVAAGVNDSDAVNFGQLTDAINNITINPTSNIKYFHANSSGSDSVASGTDSVAVGPDAHSNANNSMALGNGAVANHEGSVALGAGSVTDTTNPQGTTGVDIRGDHYDFAGTAPTSTVSVGAAGMERTVSNVAAGQISATSTDAINGSQLYATNLAIENINASMANIGQDSMFQVNNTSNLPKPVPTGKDAIAGGAGASATAENSMAIGTQAQSSHTNAVAIGANSVTDRDNSVSVGASGNERQITNVAAGTQATDAVNVSQLQQSIGNTYQYTNGKFNELKNMIDDQNDKLSAGIAGAMAMASLPQPWAPGASIVGMGGGTYQGESAISLGVSTISDNGRWVSKLSGSTNSQGDVGAAIGLGYQW